jgi:hypothetical protein
MNGPLTRIENWFVPRGCTGGLPADLASCGTPDLQQPPRTWCCLLAHAGRDRNAHSMRRNGEVAMPGVTADAQWSDRVNPGMRWGQLVFT